MDINPIQTSYRKREDSTPIVSSPNINAEEQIKIYLAEIFTLNKKIERLTNCIEDTEKMEELQSQKAQKLQSAIASTEEKSKRSIEHFTLIIEDLKQKNALLQQDSDYNDLIAYYESKIEETQLRSVANIKMFSDAINKLMKDCYHNNKDEVWRNLIKRYEKKLEELEKTISQHEKNERKIAVRQKFFEKYCFKAEEQFERIAKISKKYNIKDKETDSLKLELNKFKEDFNKEHKQKEKITSDFVELKNEHSVLKKFVNQIQVNPHPPQDKPISNTKEEKWSDIKKINEDNIKLLSYQQSHPISYEDKAIIILIRNIKEYLTISNSPPSNDIEASTNLTSILTDIENYTKMLFDKLHILLINQSYIIDIVCDLSNQLAPELKKAKPKQDTIVSKCMSILKSVCSKLVHDYTPY